MDDAHAQPTDAVLKTLEVSAEQGLSASTAAQRAAKHGPNALPDDEATPLWQLVLEQFKDQLVQILLASALISFALALLEEGDKATAFVEPLVILLILIAVRGHDLRLHLTAQNAVVGVVQETNAEKAIEVRMAHDRLC